ncbi:hypothetical protein D3C71_1284830 [compost metagenome]
MVVLAPSADQPVHDIGDVLVDGLTIGQGKMRHEASASLFFVHLLQHPVVHVRRGFQHFESDVFTGQVHDLAPLGCDETQDVGGKVPVDVQSPNNVGARVLSPQHLQVDRPVDRTHYGVRDELEVIVAQLPFVPGLYGLYQKIAFGQGSEVGAGLLPERGQFVGIERAEIDVPERLQHLVAVQAYFVGFVEPPGVRAGGIKACIDVKQVGVVLIAGAKALDHQLCQGRG